MSNTELVSPPMSRTIKISDEVHKLLIQIGGKSETFDDVIKRVVKYYIDTHKGKNS